MQVDAVPLTVEQHLEALVHQAFLVHAPTHAAGVEQIHRDLLQHTGADASKHVVRTLALDDDAVYAGFVQQLSEQQARGAGADDRDLGAHATVSKVVLQL